MPRKRRNFVSILTTSGALVAFFMFLFNVGGLKDSAWRLIEPERVKQNQTLRKANKALSHEVERLSKQNLSLKTILEAYENNFIALKDANGACHQGASPHPAELPAAISKERIEIRRAYLHMLDEKYRWDRYLQAHYKSILASTVEPRVIESRHLDLRHDESLDDFLELEDALKLHRRLIRDVREFHDEVRYQEAQLQDHRHYALYDLKFELAPFARESALVDALQQAMSALSVGIYEQEAMAVLDRIGNAFTEPIHQLYAHQTGAADPSVDLNYNFNFFTLFSEKLMDYSDSLSRQSSITLGPSAFGELDFFNRRLAESLYDLYLIGLTEAIDPEILDVSELERLLSVSD